MSEAGGTSFNDAPVTKPEDDAFGIAPFAEAVASAFRTMERPVGATIGLNGPWGSGKTSAVNLIRYHLRDDEKAGKLAVIEFRPWWFRGEEALTLAFLQELRGALEPSLGDKAKLLFGRLGRKLLQAGPIVGPAVNVVSGGLFGALAGSATDIANKLLTEGEPLEKVMADLAKALEDQNKRFLVIIDDIDRLDPGEALQVFKLIKSVGHLPNVMYLAVFDRQLAEKAVAVRYPSEGPHFLEKIIQASFELPLPLSEDLRNATLHCIQAICGVPPEAEMQRFFNIFYSAVAPYVKLPRHVVRLANALSVTWPPVKGEVDIADYVALEVMRLSEPALYTAVRGNKERLCGVRSAFGEKDAEKALLEDLEKRASGQGRTTVVEALQRLFPRLEGVGYAGDFLAGWDARRLVCIERHFDKYFRLALGEEVMPASDVAELIAHAADDPYVRQKLRIAASGTRRNGQSYVPVVLEELRVHASEVRPGDIQPLLATLFSLADEIDLERDEDRSSGFGVRTELRLHWVMRRLLDGRDLAERSAIYVSAIQGAPLSWLADFYSSAHKDYNPGDGKPPAREDDCLVLEDALPELRRLFQSRIGRAASDGSLIEHRQLAYLLFRWLDFGDDEGVAVRAWLNERLGEDSSVAALARAFTSVSYTQGMGMGFGLGDRVARRVSRAGVANLDKLMDVPAFRARIEDLAMFPSQISTEDKDAVVVFRNAWTNQDRNGDDD